jgi:hypothetical protein
LQHFKQFSEKLSHGDLIPGPDIEDSSHSDISPFGGSSISGLGITGTIVGFVITIMAATLMGIDPGPGQHRIFWHWRGWPN